MLDISPSLLSLDQAHSMKESAAEGSLPSKTPDVAESEAYQVLMARVGRKGGKIPADLLVRQIMRIVPANEWPVRVEAMDALLRRLDSPRKEGLRIDSRPQGGKVLGAYATKRQGAGSRPYTTILLGVDPIEARCDCPDFLKNSLGLCKHIFAVLEHIYSKPNLLKQARKEQEWADASRRGLLGWDPVRPLTGAGDWLGRVSWLGENPGTGKTAGRSSRSAEAFLWFEPNAEAGGAPTLRDTYRDQPAERLELVKALLKLHPSGSQGARNDPALRALLLAERAKLKRRLDGALGPSELAAGIKSLKRPLYPYQAEGVSRFLAAGRLLLADDMGLGKTAQAIACCHLLRFTGRVRRGLIIVPASLKPQWFREWSSFSRLPIEVMDGSPAERRALYESNKAGFFIINYEQLLRDLEPIWHWQPELVVLDEAQRIKNWATKTALSVKRLDPPYRLVLTGTPMENRIEELASIVEWVDDMALEPKWRLNAAHAVRADGKQEIVGVRNLETIRERLQPCMVRRVRQEVLAQLPPRTDTRVPVEMTGEQQAEHDSLIQPILVLMQRARTRPLTQAEFLRLMSLLTTQRIISNGLAQLQFLEIWPAIRKCNPEESVLKGLSAPKLIELRQLVRQLAVDQGRKVVIFSQWKRMLTLANWAVSDILGAEKLRTGFFTGSEGQQRRTQNLVEFHDDPDFRILFASDAGGVGLNLQHASNCVINLELPWNPAILEQRIGRVYRLGQKQPIDVYNLVCETGIESRIAGLVGSKQAFFKGLFDGDGDSIRFEQAGSFLSRVEKIYEGTESSFGGRSPVDDLPLEPADAESVDIDFEPTDAFEDVIEDADESRDPSIIEAASPRPADAEAAPRPRPAPSANGRGEEPGSPRSGVAVAGPNDVRALFSQLKIRRESETGNVVIEAPPEAASALSALFEGMAALLQDAARSDD